MTCLLQSSLSLTLSSGADTQHATFTLEQTPVSGVKLPRCMCYVPSPPSGSAQSSQIYCPQFPGAVITPTWAASLRARIMGWLLSRAH